MRVALRFIFAFLLILTGACSGQAFGQLGFDLKVDKPKPYEDRILRSEKTGEKPLKAPKKFFQNLTTHYNYYFNSSNKLNEVIELAKSTFKDDYTVLLPFYNYTLDETAHNAVQLDSVIYKAQTGIVMHDLRSDWVDNLYLLWGAAWYFEKKFDSAALMFQFINYAFAEKEKDGYYKYIGSHMDGNNTLTISTPEKKSESKTKSPPTSRNNAFIWQIRTQIEIGNFSQSGSLLSTLRNDPFFPNRLMSDLEEAQAYWFYKQNIWDSSASHLVKALDMAKNKQERARWEYLAAQMFEMSGQHQQAQDWYAKAITHTTDPVMEVYARLNLVRINKEGGENYVDRNIAELLKMAKHDKYQDYRDVIYFMAAQMEMERHNLGAAEELLLKGAKYNNPNQVASRSKSYFLIAGLSFDQKKYAQAASFYDSIQVNDLGPAETLLVAERKEVLSRVVRDLNSISREDSLQRIASMPEEERTVYINRLVKQLRKQQGLEEVASAGNAAINTPPTDLFQTNTTRGDWYFYNNTLKTQGAAQFKQTWGNRPNVDNWRRFADVNQQLIAKLPPGNTVDPSKTAESVLLTDNAPTYNSLLSHLPLTPSQMQVSNDSLMHAMGALGSIYLSEINDYASAIDILEKLRTRFPSNSNMNEVLFNLYYAYKKFGMDQKAEDVKRQLMQQGPGSRYATIVTTGVDPVAPNTKNRESTKSYEHIYDLFIEGKFEEAEAQKRKADSVFGTSYWQPQLLYIEAVYNIRQRNDSVAKTILKTLIAQNPSLPIASRAQTMIDVLGRRRQIEDELSRLQVERPKEDSVTNVPVVQKPLPVRKDTIVQTKKVVVPEAKPKLPTDTVAKKPIVVQKPVYAYRFDAGMKHSVMIILDKVDPMFVNEVKNAFDRYNKEKYYNQTFQITTAEFDADRRMVFIGDFANAQEAIDYLDKAKRIAPNEIIPWLKADKYSFSIMTEPNLKVLMEKKDLSEYKRFLDQNLPGKF